MSAGAAKHSWSVRLLSRIPLPVLHAAATFLGYLAEYVARYRRRFINDALHIAFPELDRRQIAALRRRYYAGFADVFVETLKASCLPAQELVRRVKLKNPELARSLLAKGRPVLLVAAHQCNWEWMLHGLALQLGYPLDAAYKPLVNPWAERAMYKIRTRFGSHIVPAQELLADIIRRRAIVRAVAMVADQEPVASEQKQWLRFLNRDTAFYLGAEEIARKTHYPALFIQMRRMRRGFYEMEFVVLSAPEESLAPGEFTQRYARLVEQQIRAAPADWPWSHKRWKLRKSLYAA